MTGIDEDSKHRFSKQFNKIFLLWPTQQIVQLLVEVPATIDTNTMLGTHSLRAAQ